MGFHRPLRRATLLFAVVPWLLLAARAQDDVATVHGRAVDRDGKPMAGCAVGLFDLSQRFDTKELLAAPRTTTDADGRYQLEAKQNYYHVVVVTTKGHQVCVQRLQSEAGAVRYMPDALMLRGATLRGRVRDAAGQPIAGAQVRVEDSLTANTFVMTWFESQASSDAKGIFEVPGVPRTGLRVTASAPGFPAVSHLAAHDSPLDFTLTATGLVRGRVLDSDGKPMPRARVSAATIEYQDGAERTESDDEGRFALTAPRAPRFRVISYEEKAPYRRFTSTLLHGPADDVVVTATTAAGGTRKVTVRCVDAASKAAIEDFRASWHSTDAKNPIIAVLRHPEERTTHHGEAVFDVTVGSALKVDGLNVEKGKSYFGLILVDAPGHGLAIVTIPDDPTGPLVAELPAECILTGRVLDADTGKPAAGAAVRALPHTNLHGGGPDPWKGDALTDADGRYRLGGLAAGKYDVQVYGVGRPAAKSAPATVDPANETTLDLEVPKARFLEFELVGEIPANCLGSITWQGGFSGSGSDGMMLQAMIPGPPAVPLVGPRTHKLGPIGNGQFRATLQLPTRDRLGSCLTIDLGEVAVAGTKLQLPDVRQFVHTGRVELPPDVPPERVALVAQRITKRGRNDPLSGMGMDAPFAVCLGSDGSFVIDLVPGKYALQLADLETRMIFFTEEQDRDLGADTANTPLAITPTIRWLDVAFEPTVAGAPIVCNSVAIDAERPRAGALPVMLGNSSGSNLRQQGYWAFRHGTTHLRWLVATGNLKLQATQSPEMLMSDSNGWNSKPVDSVELDITEPVHRAVLRIPPPPPDAELERPAAK